VGDKVDVTLLRDGKPRHVSVAVGERAEVTAKNAGEIHHGLQGAHLDDAPDAGGVLVRSVDNNSTAAQNGLRANDVIIGVGRNRITNVDDLRKALTGQNAFRIMIRRGNTTIVGVIN
ncbi:MAG TPA: PDZ domain-containing protein, partial [Steroidobacteraceae bacterium]|nr:PDZ domain-containing protein [Steroidobacteraceae bacterium]